MFPLRLFISAWLLLAVLRVLGTGPASVKSLLQAIRVQPADIPKRRDVVLVTIDSLRADHVGVYGYKRPTTPNLDRLAQRGVRFERAYSQTPVTEFSIAALLTGRYFATLTRLVPGARFETLAQRLGAQGFTTAAVYPQAVHSTGEKILAPYAAEQFGFRHARQDYLSAEQSVDAAIDFFERERPAQALLWVHLFEPHEPYAAGGAPSFGYRDIDRYDQEIVVADAALGRLSRYLEAHRAGAVLIVTSDHGEAFDEHEERYHGTNLHEEQIRVPLMIAAPGLLPRVVDEAVQLIDLFPTVLRLTGTAGLPDVDGQDLSPLLEGKTEPGRAAFSAVGVQRMIVRGQSKLIWDLQKETAQLFDLSGDPAELYDVSQKQARQTEILRSELSRWIEARLLAAERIGSSLSAPAVPEPILRARLGEASAADSLVPLLDASEGLAHGREAARLLVQLPPRPATFSKLVKLRLDDPVSADWVNVAAFRLGYLPAQRQVEQILFGATPDFALRLRAAEALAWRRVRGAEQALLQLLDDCPDADSCRQVIGALGQLGDRSAVAALVTRLKNPMMQRESIRALGQIGGPESIVPLVGCLLHDEHTLARQEAARALRTVSSPLVKYSLWQAVLRDPEQAVRDAAWMTLADLADSATIERPMFP